MATGPEHFKEAEGRLRASDYQRQDDHEDALMCAIHEALVAGVHARLAAVYAHNRATTELTGLLRAMLDQIREAQEPAS